MDPEQNTWGILDLCNGSQDENYFSYSLFLDEGQEDIQYSNGVCVPGNGRYEFIIQDFGYNGIANPEGEFDYSFIYDGEVVAEGVLDEFINTVAFGDDACPPTRHLRNSKQRKW